MSSHLILKTVYNLDAKIYGTGIGDQPKCFIGNFKLTSFELSLIRLHVYRVFQILNTFQLLAVVIYSIFHMLLSLQVFLIYHNKEIDHICIV
jgi:hypothetical protein